MLRWMRETPDSPVRHDPLPGATRRREGDATAKLRGLARGEGRRKRSSFSPQAQPTKSATEELIIKIQVEGKVDEFAWVVPLPNKPETREESAALFLECFDYVESRLSPKPKFGGNRFSKRRLLVRPMCSRHAVEVLSREVVGSYDVAVVKENEVARSTSG